jgi:fucose permease
VAPRARRHEQLTIYLIGLFQGLALVAVPAAATVLTSPTGYGLSKSQYGLLFVPQVVMAIAGSLSLPALGRRFRLKSILLAAVGADVVAMAVLAASDAVAGTPAAVPMLMTATGFLGLGFGLCLGSISTYAGGFQPDRREVALTSLNVLLGLGTALSPLLIGVLLHHGEWWYLPLAVAVGLAGLALVALAEPLADPERGPHRAGSARAPVPTVFWLFAAALVIYGIAETMFGNWGTTLLTGRGVPASQATDALAVFWASVTVGRLAIALVSNRVRSTRIYVVLPWAIVATLVAASVVTSAGGGLAVFALGGLACSGFFPMTIGYGEATFPALVELTAGWLIAAYQLGYGLAAFGGGALQRAVSLPTLFRLAAGLAAVMGGLAMAIARRQRPAPADPVTGRPVQP